MLQEIKSVIYSYLRSPDLLTELSYRSGIRIGPNCTPTCLFGGIGLASFIMSLENFVIGFGSDSTELGWSGPIT